MAPLTWIYCNLQNCPYSITLRSGRFEVHLPSSLPNVKQTQTTGILDATEVATPVNFRYKLLDTVPTLNNCNSIKNYRTRSLLSLQNQLTTYPDQQLGITSSKSLAEGKFRTKFPSTNIARGVTKL